LEYLNGYVPPVPVAKKGIPVWVWAVLGVVLVGVVLFLLLGKKAEPQVVEVEKIVVVHDTLYIQQIAEIEKNFNAAEFELGKAELSEDAKFVLHDLAKVMKDNEGLTLKILGHTSAEGDAQLNQKLSEARAKAAVDFLVEREGVAAERLSYEGLGSSQLKNTENPNAPENRRTEFVVVE
jgi:outer membrane protein OmpA-like peptidoglycan-associated protein